MNPLKAYFENLASGKVHGWPRLPEVVHELWVDALSAALSHWCYCGRKCQSCYHLIQHQALFTKYMTTKALERCLSRLSIGTIYKTEKNIHSPLKHKTQKPFPHFVMWVSLLYKLTVVTLKTFSWWGAMRCSLVIWPHLALPGVKM